MLDAILSGELEYVKRLHEKGADLNLSNSNGITPLGLAVMNGHLEMVEFFLENNVKMTPFGWDAVGKSLPVVLSAILISPDDRVVESIMRHTDTLPGDMFALTLRVGSQFSHEKKVIERNAWEWATTKDRAPACFAMGRIGGLPME